MLGALPVAPQPLRDPYGPDSPDGHKMADMVELGPAYGKFGPTGRWFGVSTGRMVLSGCDVTSRRTL